MERGINLQEQMNFKKSHYNSYMEIQNFGDLDLFIKKKYNDIGGLNITIPFKKYISKYCIEIDKSASDLDSINYLHSFSQDNIMFRRYM